MHQLLNLFTDFDKAQNLNLFLNKAGLADFNWPDNFKKSDWPDLSPLPKGVEMIEKSEMSEMLRIFFDEADMNNFWPDFFNKIDSDFLKIIKIDDDTNLTESLSLPLISNGLEILVVLVGINSRIDISRLGQADNFRGNLFFMCLAEGAKVNYQSLHDGDDSDQISVEQFFLKNDARLTSRLASFDQSHGFHLTAVTSIGNNTEVKMEAIFALNNAQKQVVKLHKEFIGKGSKGRIQAYGLLEDSSRATMEGKIVIGKKANQTDSSLHEKILLLGDKAHCQALPVLEINTDDVKAGHGASISQVNPEDLFYLLSRGIDKKQAICLIKQGFLLGPIAEMANEHVWKKAVSRKLQ